MFKYIIFCLFLINSFMLSAQDHSVVFEHNAFLVADVNRSAEFYSDVLGLREISVPDAPETRRWFSLGDPLQLHLIEGQNGNLVHIKSVHMAVRTTDLDVLMKVLRSRNYPFESWQGDKNTFNVRADGIRQIYLQDPDGYWIEINDTAEDSK